MLKAHNLTFWRGWQPIFQNICFDLKSGQFLHVQGKNGSGKTTLLKIVADLLKPTTGHVVRTPKLRLGYLGHNLPLRPYLTVQEQILSWQYTFNTLKNNKTQALLEEAGLKALSDIPIMHLSAGFKQRLALVQILSLDLDVCILDEPMINLDKSANTWLQQCLAFFQQKGGILIFSSHQPLDLIAQTLLLEER